MINIINVAYPAPEGPMTPRDIGQITDAIIHHTAGNKGQQPLDIDKEHRAIHDAMIAYNYVIGVKGEIWMGRPVEAVPAAAFGRNPESLNIVLTGNFESSDPGFTGPPSEAQVASLRDLLVFVHRRFPHIVSTYGHRDVAARFYPKQPGKYATKCPGNTLYALLPDIKVWVYKQLNTH